MKPLAEGAIRSESELEDLVARRPEILREDLMVIGRQVQVEELKDRIDLLAIDSNLNTVVIEIKKGQVKGGIDIQSLKYASYVSNWTFDQLREIADSYFRDNKVEKTFANALEEFAGEDIDYEDVNKRQRIILVGTDFDPRIVSVGKWLIDQGVPIKFVKISVLTDGSNVFLKSDVILEPAGPAVPPVAARGKPWIENGQDWHLNQRCNRQTAEKLRELVEYLTSLEGVEVSWNQEFYVAFILAQYNWITVVTFPNQLNVRVNVEAGYFNEEMVARELGIREDKIEVEQRGKRDRITIKIGPDFNLKDQGFAKFIEKARESFLKTI